MQKDGATRSHFLHFSAVRAGVKQIREVIDEARDVLRLHGKGTILFVDEIHRFNKAQQEYLSEAKDIIMDK